MGFEISGVTKDDAGALLGSCECFLFKYDSGANTLTQSDFVTSDAVTGAYTFAAIADDDPAYLVTAFKDGAPSFYDASDHNLQPLFV